MAPKITNFIIALILVGVAIGIITLFLSDINQNYQTNLDSTDLVTYNQLNNITQLTEDIESAANDQGENTGVLDIIGNYFSRGYKALRLAGSSIDIFDSMSNTAIDQAGLGVTGGLLKTAISSIVLVLIIIGVLIAAIVKRDL